MKIRSAGVFALVLSAVVSFVGCKSQTSKAHSDEAGAATAAASVKPYPLTKCVVSGEGFEHGQPYTFVYNGQQIKLCCKDCLADFNKDPQKYLAKINEAK